MKMMFVDNRIEEVERQWRLCVRVRNKHQLLPLEPFKSVERTCSLVREFEPTHILIGHGLGRSDVNGADVIRALLKDGFRGTFIANSGGGNELFAKDGIALKYDAMRSSKKLQDIVNELNREITSQNLQSEKNLSLSLLDKDSEEVKIARDCQENCVWQSINLKYL